MKNRVTKVMIWAGGLFRQSANHNKPGCNLTPVPPLPAGLHPGKRILVKLPHFPKQNRGNTVGFKKNGNPYPYYLQWLDNPTGSLKKNIFHFSENY
ncbi:MAG TPA: hypothetical protein PKV71_08255 [Calditrichia bacterium]|nr:hypothetical protein [Calditrichota bacterium]HQU72445.1 hypothetical protein [Calditrichia bacterium]HQV31853.1 hypothetical protein [Calditrichia bacterium]